MPCPNARHAAFTGATAGCHRSCCWLPPPSLGPPLVSPLPPSTDPLGANTLSIGYDVVYSILSDQVSAFQSYAVPSIWILTWEFTVIKAVSSWRFTYRNLVQSKYIMLEAIAINKIILRDQKTCCMKPDLQVNLLLDAVEGSVMQKGETRYSALRRLFRQRVVDFFRIHPKGDDIPEHELPHPFTQTKPSVA